MAGMATFPLTYAPGVVADDTVMARSGRFTDANGVRWVRDGADQPLYPEMVGGFERLTLDALSGVCRNVHAWNDNDGLLNLAFGTHSHLYVWRGGGLYDITPTLARPSATLGANPLTTTNTSTAVKVTWPGHGLAAGDAFTLSGAADTGGVTAANLNGSRTVLAVVDGDSFTFTAGAAATSGATGGGSAVVITPQQAYAAGQINGTGTQGYGTGGYGVGGYGQPSTADYFPRTWSFGNLGEALIASYRGGPIYEWNNDTSAVAAPIANSPRQVTAILVTPEHAIMAMGCNAEVSGVLDPRCVRTCDVTDETVWNTGFGTTAEEKVLEGAGRIVGGRLVGYSSLIWTSNEVWEVAYVGATDEVYRYTRQGDDCGLIGPNAAAVKGQTAYWLAPDLQFYAIGLGGEPVELDSPIREEVRANLTPSQKDKIVGSSLSAYGEVWWFYPDARDGLEVSRAVFMSIGGGWWSKQQIVRTAFIDAGPANYPVGVDADGKIYWHERGQTADGGQRTASLSAGPVFVSAGQQSVMMRAFWPDFTSQQGTMTFSVSTREKPQSADVTTAGLMIAPNQEKVDLHVEGRIVSWSISMTAGPGDFRMGTPIVEGKVVSRRPK
jgi:hypothetical protein